MKILIIDAALKNICLSIIINKKVYTCTHVNSKNNFEKLIILINKFLDEYKIKINEIGEVYVNRGPGSFAGIRNSLSIAKALNLANKIDYYCFSFSDFKISNNIEYKDVPNLCDKFKVKKNLLKPSYLS